MFFGRTTNVFNGVFKRNFKGEKSENIDNVTLFFNRSKNKEIIRPKLSSKLAYFFEIGLKC